MMNMVKRSANLSSYTVWLQIFMRQYFCKFRQYLVYHENISLENFSTLQMFSSQLNEYFKAVSKSFHHHQMENFPVAASSICNTATLAERLNSGQLALLLIAIAVEHGALMLQVMTLMSLCKIYYIVQSLFLVNNESQAMVMCVVSYSCNIFSTPIYCSYSYINQIYQVASQPTGLDVL